MTTPGTAERPRVRLERALGLTFNDSQLLELALTHRSYAHEHPEEGERNNERLEFLGDAIFQFLVADTLYRRFPETPEGRLTALRAALVSTESFAAIGESLELAPEVRVSRGEAALEGRGRHSILAGCVEAIVAAVYLDAGLPAATELVDRLIEPRLEAVLREDAPVNVKGRLQEIIQAERGVTPAYRVVSRSGPVHAERFTVEVLAGDTVLGTGEGIGKKQAEQRAAAAALEELGPRDSLPRQEQPVELDDSTEDQGSAYGQNGETSQRGGAGA